LERMEILMVQGSNQPRGTFLGGKGRENRRLGARAK